MISQHSAAEEAVGNLRFITEQTSPIVNTESNLIKDPEGSVKKLFDHPMPNSHTI